MKYIATVQVPISHLYFVDVGKRLPSKRQTERLKILFGKTSINHQNHRHWIDGYIDNSVVPSILDHFGGLSALRQSNAVGCHPLLHDQYVAYTHGQRRMEAAKQIEPNSSWTILLFTTDISTLSTNPSVRRRTEQCQHEEPHTDGHIYSKLRQYDTGSVDFINWYMALTDNKQKAFEAINKHFHIAKAIDRLIDFPGIIDALHLGNYCKYFSWRQFDEAILCLNHIYRTWSGYIGGRMLLGKYLTAGTVKLLEGRAPAISQTDYEWVQAAFKSKQAFPGVNDISLREDIERKVLGTSFMIPSLRSFQANMLYLGIASQIIWRLLISKELKRPVKTEDAETSLRSALRGCWVESPPYVEVEEGEFQPVLGPPNFQLAYNTVVLAALRQFPFMSSDRPKIERGESIPEFPIDPRCKALFQRRAKLVGFRSKLIDEGASAVLPPFVPEKLGDAMAVDDMDEETFLNRTDRRWGRPFARVFPLIQESAFLPRMLENNTAYIDGAFVMKDLMQSFLLPCSIRFDHSRPRVRLNSQQHDQMEDQLLERPLGRPLDLYSAGHTDGSDMEVDSPLTSLRHDTRDEDTIMEDLLEDPPPLGADEESHFWDHLLLEYETCSSSPSDSSSASSLLQDPPCPKKKTFNKPSSRSPSRRMTLQPHCPTLQDQEVRTFEHGSMSQETSFAARKGQVQSFYSSKDPRSTVPSPFPHGSTIGLRSPHHDRISSTSYNTLSLRPRSVLPSPLRMGKIEGQDSMGSQACRISCTSLNSSIRPRSVLPSPSHPTGTKISSARHSPQRGISFHSSLRPRSVLPSPKIHPSSSRSLEESARSNGNTSEPFTRDDQNFRISLGSSIYDLSLVPSLSSNQTSSAWNPSSSISAYSLPNSIDISQSGQSLAVSQISDYLPMLPHQFAPTLPSISSDSTPPRSTCPTPQSCLDHTIAKNNSRLQIAHQSQNQLPQNWQGFIDSDDSMTTISF